MAPGALANAVRRRAAKKSAMRGSCVKRSSPEIITVRIERASRWQVGLLGAPIKITANQ
jgi:hypothetical protein